MEILNYLDKFDCCQGMSSIFSSTSQKGISNVLAKGFQYDKNGLHQQYLNFGAANNNQPFQSDDTIISLIDSRSDQKTLTQTNFSRSNLKISSIQRATPCNHGKIINKMKTFFEYSSFKVFKVLLKQLTLIGNSNLLI